MICASLQIKGYARHCRYADNNWEAKDNKTIPMDKMIVQQMQAIEMMKLVVNESVL